MIGAHKVDVLFKSKKLDRHDPVWKPWCFTSILVFVGKVFKRQKGCANFKTLEFLQRFRLLRGPGPGPHGTIWGHMGPYLIQYVLFSAFMGFLSSRLKFQFPCHRAFKWHQHRREPDPSLHLQFSRNTHHSKAQALPTASDPSTVILISHSAELCSISGGREAMVRGPEGCPGIIGGLCFIFWHCFLIPN